MSLLTIRLMCGQKMQNNKKYKFDNEIDFVIKAKRGGTRQGSGAKPK